MRKNDHAMPRKKKHRPKNLNRKLRPYQRRMVTPEREKMLRKRWRTYDDSKDILAAFNAMPGQEAPSIALLWLLCFRLRIKRPANYRIVNQARLRGVARGVAIAVRAAQRAIRNETDPGPQPPPPKKIRVKKEPIVKMPVPTWLAQQKRKATMAANRPARLAKRAAEKERRLGPLFG